MTSDQKTIPVLKLKSTAQEDLVLFTIGVMLGLSRDSLRISVLWANSREGWPSLALQLVPSCGSWASWQIVCNYYRLHYLYISLQTGTFVSSLGGEANLGANWWHRVTWVKQWINFYFIRIVRHIMFCMENSSLTVYLMITFIFNIFLSLLTHLLALITTIRTVSVSITSPAAVNTKVMLQANKFLCSAHFCEVSYQFISAIYFIQTICTIWIEKKRYKFVNKWW